MSTAGHRMDPVYWKAVADAAAVELTGADALETLAWTARTFGDRWIVASSMQDALLIDLAVRVHPAVDVLFLQTGYHFPETLGTRDAVTAVYPRLRVIEAESERSVAEQEAAYGTLHRTDPGRCCELRKVLPLRRALAGYDAWVTGIRRTDAPSRADAPLVSWDERHGLVKVNPIAAWSDEQAECYLAERGVLRNPLVAEGYTSIGCAPCTGKPAPGEGPRGGRWAGQGKTECGLHG